MSKASSAFDVLGISGVLSFTQVLIDKFNTQRNGVSSNLPLMRVHRR